MILIKNNEAFRKSLDQIATFVDECNVHFNDTGIKIIAFDNAQIIYLEYELSNEGIEGEIPSAIFGINVVEFNKIMSKINSQDQLYLDIKEQSLDVIIKGQYNRTFSFPQKIVDEKSLDIVINDYPVKLNLDGEILKDIFISSRVVSDSVVFDCCKSEIGISAEGLYGKYKTKIIDTCDLPFKAKFSSIHLGNMLKGANNDTKIELRLSSRYPFYLNYNIGDNTLKFYLAHMFI